MKILIVSGYFYPQNTPRAFRTAELAKRFCELGHDVTVYIPQNDYDYTSFIKEYPITIRFYQGFKGRNKFVGIPIIDRVIYRVLYQFLAYPDRWNIKPLMKALRKEAGYDLLVSIAMPYSTHWALGKLYNKGIKAAKCWVADCGDPFMLSGSNNFKQPFYFKSLETRWCRMCNFISVPTDKSYDGYYPEFREKIRVIPQGFDFSDIRTKEYKKNAVPIFAYSGSTIPVRRDLRPILDILIKKKADFELHIYTSQKDIYSYYKEQLGEKLQLHDYIPRLELLEKLSGMDFLLNLDNGTTVQTPSKLIDYALTGRPILSLNSCNIDEALLESFLNGDYSGQYEVDNLDQYNITTVAQQFLDLCK